MQSHHHSQPQPTPSTSLKSIFRPQKTHLSFTFKKSSLFYDDITNDQATESFFKTLKVNKRLRTPSGITSLILDSSKIDERFRRSGSRKVSADLLKEFRNLHSLKMTNVSFKDFSVLGKAFKSLRGLKNLEITFVGISSEDERNSLQDFIKAFSPRLNQLKLNFPGYYNPDLGRGPNYNRYHLRDFRLDRLKNLQKLALSFPIASFLREKENRRYIDLSPMKNFNQLQSLDITLVDHSTDMTREIDTKQLYFNPNELFPNLKQFTWSIPSFSSPEAKKLELIGPQIASKLKYLYDFGLAFRHGRAKTSFLELSLCLATLQTKLNSLHFVYNEGEFSEKDTKTFLSALSLQRLKSLHTLSLEFKHCKEITYRFLMDFAQACAENFTGLRSLRLSFEHIEQEETNMQFFVKAFFGTEGISDRGIINLASILSKECRQLEFLSLQFKEYSQIFDIGVKNLCQKLNRLERLKTVWIKFEDCQFVTEMGCKESAQLLGAHRQVAIYECKSSKLCL